MIHPHSRAERRHNGEVWRNRQRNIMLHWYGYRLRLIGSGNIWDPELNNMWWARKRSYGHGNRCMCHYEKRDRSIVRKRRRDLDAEIELNISSWKD